MQSTFGEELRRWRQVRGASQLDLALKADVSQRHVSFLETGRSQPSRFMVLHLAAALDLPLRARNALLLAAGFAPAYPERPLDAPAMEHVHHVLDLVLHAHEPFPAYVIDRCWSLLLSNMAARRLTGLLPDPATAAAASDGNILKLCLHPDGLRPHIVNWHEAAAVLLHRLEREVAHYRDDPELEDLLTELRTLPDLSDIPPRQDEPGIDDLLAPLHLEVGGLELRLFTTIATIGAPYDVTLEELRLETLLPADRATEVALRDLAAESAPA